MPENDKEKRVFSQEVNRDDLNAATGGAQNDWECQATQTLNCLKHHYREIHGGKGFPNCANTVEDGSHCEHSDACYSETVFYRGMNCVIFDCHKAWR